MLEILAQLPKGQTKKEITEQQGKALDYVAKMVYNAHLDEADLEFFLGKNSKKVEAIIRAAEEYEDELVKKSLEEHREDKKNLVDSFVHKYSQDVGTKPVLAPPVQDVETETVHTVLDKEPFAGPNIKKTEP